MGVTYDTGALLAAEANRREVWALHARSLQRGTRPVVPAAVLGQAWRGGPQAMLPRLLRGCRIEVLDDPPHVRSGWRAPAPARGTSSTPQSSSGPWRGEISWSRAIPRTSTGFRTQLAQSSASTVSEVMRAKAGSTSRDAEHACA